MEETGVIKIETPSRYMTIKDRRKRKKVGGGGWGKGGGGGGSRNEQYKGLTINVGKGKHVFLIRRKKQRQWNGTEVVEGGT